MVGGVPSTSAPRTESTTSPALMNLIVGMAALVNVNLDEDAAWVPRYIWNGKTQPGCLAIVPAICSSNGASALHGGHQVAKKSTTTSLEQRDQHE